MNFIEKFKSFKIPEINQVLNLKKIKNTSYGGASASTIFIHRDYACKIVASFNKSQHSDLYYRNEEEEIKFYQTFTKKLILTNKTPHLVGCYEVLPFNIKKALQDHKCILNPKEHIEKVARRRTLKKDNQKVQKKKTKKKVKRILISNQHPICRYSENQDKLCSFWRYQNEGTNQKNFYAVFLEKCDYGPLEALWELSKVKFNSRDLESYIDRIVFQYAYTMIAIYSEYPNFIHNDMFLRNVLGIKNKAKKNQYLKYICFGKDYYLPARGIMIKINDFGFSVTEKELGDLTLIKNLNLINSKCDDSHPRKFETDNKSNQDTFNFILELYQRKDKWGLHENLINFLATNQVKNLTRIRYNLRKAIGKYFKIDQYDQILENMKRDHTKSSYIPWSPKGISSLENIVPKPEEWFKNGLFDHYCQIPEGKFEIIAEYSF